MGAFRVFKQGRFSKAFNTDVLKNKRLAWVDYLRGIAIILVVYHHARVGIERSHITVPEILVNANMIFYSFRMPLFFILSGIFINHSLSKKTTKQFAWIKFENLLYPYLIWSFIQVSLQIGLSDFTNSARSFIDYTYILYQPRRLDQFWYLPALFNATIIFLLIKRFFNPSLVVHLLIGVSFYFLSPFTAKISMISDWMGFYIFFALGHVCSDLFFQEKSQRFLKSPTSLLLIIPVFVAAQVFYLKYEIGQQTLAVDAKLTGFEYISRVTNQVYFLLIALVGCVTIFIISFLLERWNKFSFIRILGIHSLCMYVMHVMVVAFVRVILVSVANIQNPIFLLLSGIFFGLTIPIIFYNLFVKENAGWFLFSMHKKRKRHQTPVNELVPASVQAKSIVSS